MSLKCNNPVVYQNHTFSLKHNIYTKYTQKVQSAQRDIREMLCLKLLIIIIYCGIIGGILYGAYLVIKEGIEVRDYGNSFTFEGKCECTSETTTIEEVDHYHETSRSVRKYTLYHYIWVVIEHEKCVNADKVLENLSFSSSNSFDINNVGDIIACYTNANCDKIYLNTDSKYDDEATGAFVGASFILLLSVFCCCSLCLLFFVPFANDDLERSTHAFNEWRKMTEEQRLDYYLSYESKNFGINLGDSIHIIYAYYSNSTAREFEIRGLFSQRYNSTR